MQCVCVQSIWTKDASGWDEGGRRDWKFTVDANLVGFYRQTERRDFEWCVHRGGEKGKRGAVAVCLRSIRGERERSGLGNVVTTYWIARPGWIASPLFSAPVIFPSNVSSGGVGWGGGKETVSDVQRRREKIKGWDEGDRERQTAIYLSGSSFFLFFCVSVCGKLNRLKLHSMMSREWIGEGEREMNVHWGELPLLLDASSSCKGRVYADEMDGWMDGVVSTLQFRVVGFLFLFRACVGPSVCRMSIDWPLVLLVDAATAAMSLIAAVLHPIKRWMVKGLRLQQFDTIDCCCCCCYLT